MGLLDILSGIGGGGVASDPRTRSAPPSQGMSPMAKALLGLLAIYAMKNLRRADAPAAQPAPRPGGDLGTALPGGRGGGGLGDVLGGLLGGAAAGTVLKQLQQSGQGDVAYSWFGPGENKSISEGDLANALGGDTLDTLAHETGLGRDDLLSGLSRHLPRFVDQLTPDGRLPTEQEADRMV
jgi:uncharacterized protein YidB (DUF937 family)